MTIPEKTGRRGVTRSAVGDRANRLRSDFLRIDSQVALTFSDIALKATDPEKKTRTTQTARKAYDAILRLRKDIELNHAEADKLEVNLQRLKSELQRLGESF